MRLRITREGLLRALGFVLDVVAMSFALAVAFAVTWGLVQVINKLVEHYSTIV